MARTSGGQARLPLHQPQRGEPAGARAAPAPRTVRAAQRTMGPGGSGGGRRPPCRAPRPGLRGGQRDPPAGRPGREAAGGPERRPRHRRPLPGWWQPGGHLTRPRVIPLPRVIRGQAPRRAVPGVPRPGAVRVRFGRQRGSVPFVSPRAGTRPPVPAAWREPWSDVRCRPELYGRPREGFSPGRQPAGRCRSGGRVRAAPASRLGPGRPGGDRMGWDGMGQDWLLLAPGRGHHPGFPEWL